MSSPVTIPRTFINMSASPTIDLTQMPPLPVRRTPVSDITDIIIISESEDENNDTSHRNNSNYHFNDNTNSLLSFDSQSIFNSSTRHSSNNIQDSSGNNTNYNLRSGLTGLGTNGSSSNRGTSTRPSRRPNSIRGLLDFMFTTVNQANNNNNHRHRHHSSAFHPYASTAEVLLTANDIRYGTNNSSGSSRSPMTTFYDSNRANTNINSNDVQILNTPPRRRTNNSPKPPILSGHARDLDDSHTLICADCNELLYEKLWALSNCGHVVCGSCVDKYKYSEKKKILCPSCKKTVNSKNILQLYV